MVLMLMSTIQPTPPTCVQQNVPAESKPVETVTVPTLAAHKRLQARVKATEERLDALENGTRTARKRPGRGGETGGTGEGRRQPARAPPIQIEWVPRDGDPATLDRFHGERSQVDHDGLGFRVYKQKAGDLNAWMVTVAVINGYRGRGPAYFENFRIAHNEKTLERIGGKHVIIPRGAIVRRFWLGADADQAKDWAWVDDPRPTPTWANEQALAEVGKYSRTVGPYDFYWPDTDLSNTHGGQGVGPFHGGPDDWLTCPGGRRLREHQMLASYQRPIWVLEPVADQPYWMGRTKLHRLKGYRGVPDDWCPYGKKLDVVRFADHTHLTRNTAGAAALAGWDLFARDCLEVTFTDFEAANSLTREVEQGYHLLWPLWKKIEVANGPANSEGHRGLAHLMRLVRWCKPHLPSERVKPYEEGLRQWARKLAHPVYGYTCTDNQDILDPDNDYKLVLEKPTIQTFHQQLCSYAFHRLGGLDDIVFSLNAHLTPTPPWFFEAREGGMADTCLERKGFRPGPADYSAFTHGVLLNYDNPAQLLADAAKRGVNGSSQPMDSTPRAIWEPGLTQ